MFIELNNLWIYMLKAKNLLDSTNFFFLTNMKRMVEWYYIFSITKKIKIKKYIALFLASIENLKILKYTFS